MAVRARRAGRGWGPSPWLGCLLLSLIFGGIFVGGIVSEVAIRRAPLPAGLNRPPPETAALTDRQGGLLAVRPTESARASFPRKLQDLGPWLPAATVAIEDHRFFAHAGVDLVATSGAALRNLRSGRVVSGGSTLTQQLIKLSFPPRKRSLQEKLQESLCAWKLERTWSKARILESYLNRLDYGNRRIGPEAAARAYFGKSAKDLSLAEAIFLAGLPQSPTRLNPWRNPEAALTRYRHNIERLAALGRLPEGADAAALLAAPPKVGDFDPPATARHFLERVDPARGPVTSLDPGLQQATETALRDHLTTLRILGGGDAAVVILDNATGEVRALAGAGDPGHAAVNAALTPRSCGSTLKPFVYLTAIDRRQLTAATLLPDTPDAITAEYADYDPQNYTSRHLGPVRVREALGNSLNVPAVVVLSRLGARDTFAQLREWGLDFPGAFDAYGAGFLLGNAPVRLLDLASAYAALARGGEAWPARFTPRDPISSRRVASPEACAIITDVLCDNAARRGSFGANSPLHLPERTAVKTGTSSGFRDGWCVGFNRDHTVAVWAGNLNGRPMAEALAVKSAAPLWAALMKMLYARGDRPLEAPKEGADLRKTSVDAMTGLLPVDGRPQMEEWFLAGTEPADTAASMVEEGQLVLPTEYAVWCAGPHNYLGAQVREEKLRIVFPKEGAVFEMNPHLPEGQQTLLLQSTRADCEWFLNGEKLEGAKIVLKTGSWELTARSGNETATARFRVD